MRLSTVIWSVLGLILLVFGGSRIMAGLGDRETQIRRQMAAMIESVTDTGGGRLGRYVSRQYMDEDTGLDCGGPSWASVIDELADRVMAVAIVTTVSFFIRCPPNRRSC